MEAGEWEYPEMPAPAECVDDETGHETANADPTQKPDEVNSHPDTSFMKEENVCLNAGAKTLARRIGKGANDSGGFETVP